MVASRLYRHDASLGSRAVTRAAIKMPAQPARPSHLRDHPGPHLPGWIVTDVLPMPALELRHPVAFGILMEANDTPFHAGCSRVCLTQMQISCRHYKACAHTNKVLPQPHRWRTVATRSSAPLR